MTNAKVALRSSRHQQAKDVHRRSRSIQASEGGRPRRPQTRKPSWLDNVSFQTLRPSHWPSKSRFDRIRQAACSKPRHAKTVRATFAHDSREGCPPKLALNSGERRWAVT